MTAAKLQDAQGNQIKIRHTQIPNVYLDHACRILSPAEFKVLMIISRFTFGWGRSESEISFGKLAEYTGLSTRGIVKCIERLEKEGMIKVERGAWKDGKKNHYRIDFEWRSIGTEFQESESSHGTELHDSHGTELHEKSDSRRTEFHIYKEKNLKKKRNTKSEPKKVLPAGDHPLFIKYFCDHWQKHIGEKYPFGKEGGKNGKIVKELLADYDLEKLKGLVIDFFNSSEPFIKDSGYTLGVFKSKIPSLLSKQRKADPEAEQAQRRAQRLRNRGLDWGES